MKIESNLGVIEVEFDIGDIVSLKSGGPSMTVVGGDSTTSGKKSTPVIVCMHWNHGDCCFDTVRFHPGALIHDAKPEKPIAAFIRNAASGRSIDDG